MLENENAMTCRSYATQANLTVLKYVCHRHLCYIDSETNTNKVFHLVLKTCYQVTLQDNVICFCKLHIHCIMFYCSQLLVSIQTHLPAWEVLRSRQRRSAARAATATLQHLQLQLWVWKNWRIDAESCHSYFVTIYRVCTLTPLFRSSNHSYLAMA